MNENRMLAMREMVCDADYSKKNRTREPMLNSTGTVFVSVTVGDLMLVDALFDQPAVDANGNRL